MPFTEVIYKDYDELEEILYADKIRNNLSFECSWLGEQKIDLKFKSNLVYKIKDNFNKLRGLRKKYPIFSVTGEATSLFLALTYKFCPEIYPKGAIFNPYNPGPAEGFFITLLPILIGAFLDRPFYAELQRRR